MASSLVFFQPLASSMVCFQPLDSDYGILVFVGVFLGQVFFCFGAAIGLFVLFSFLAFFLFTAFVKSYHVISFMQ